MFNNALLKNLRWLAALLFALAAMSLPGCAHRKAAPDSAEASTDNFQKVQAAGIRPVAVGEFRSEASPTEAQYLKDTLVAELQGAGVLDAASSAVVQGELLQTRMGRHKGSVAARFTVTSQVDGRIIYDRELRTTASWPHETDAAKERSAVYRTLVGLLFTDPGFRNAVPR